MWLSGHTDLSLLLSAKYILEVVPEQHTQLFYGVYHLHIVRDTSVKKACMSSRTCISSFLSVPFQVRASAGPLPPRKPGGFSPLSASVLEGDAFLGSLCELLALLDL